jgi:hypothetical protein
MSSLMRAFVARKQRRKRNRFLTRPSLIRRRRRLFVLVPVIFLVDIVRVLFIDLLLILTNNSPTRLDKIDRPTMARTSNPAPPTPEASPPQPRRSTRIKKVRF